MSIRKFAVAALVATSIVSMPIAAQAAKGHRTAVSKVAAVKKGASHLGTETIIIGVVAVVAVAGGIALASNNNSAKSP